MSVKIRLSRKGRSKAPFYHIVVADARSPRDGKFIEKIGMYNPMTKPASIEIDRDAAYNWLVKGAQPTDTVRAILRFKGVYFKKHLMRGLQKGALTQEQVDTMLADWIQAKESKIQSRIEKNKADQEAFRKAVSGEAKKPKAPVADASAKETADAIFHAGEDAGVDQAADVNTEVVAESAADVTVEEVVESPVEEVAEVAEEAVESSVEEVAEVVEVVEEAVVEETPAEEAVTEEIVEAEATETEGDATEEAPKGEETEE